MKKMNKNCVCGRHHGTKKRDECDRMPHVNNIVLSLYVRSLAGWSHVLNTVLHCSTYMKVIKQEAQVHNSTGTNKKTEKKNCPSFRPTNQSKKWGDISRSNFQCKTDIEA